MTVRSGGERVLDGVDVCVPGGAVVAVVGRSGAGKSVLAAVAGRLLDPDTGDVTLDGVPMASIGRAALRRAVVYAFDRPACSAGPHARRSRSESRVPPPHRYWPPRGTRPPASFSGACQPAWIRPQRRLRCRAGRSSGSGWPRVRARGSGPAADPDDAMSSLDTVTEMRVSQALTSHLGGRTCLIIAHRAATAARADLVAWLDRGKRVRSAASRLWADPGYRSVFTPGAVELATADG